MIDLTIILSNQIETKVQIQLPIICPHNLKQTQDYKFTKKQREFYVSKPGAAHLDGEHTVFGEIISGYSVIPKITQVERDSKDWPIEDLFIDSVKVVR